MKSDCEITGATIVSTQGTFRGSIAIHGDRIVGLLAEPTRMAVRTIDATGLVALPGMVDQHVHFMDPGPEGAQRSGLPVEQEHGCQCGERSPGLQRQHQQCLPWTPWEPRDGEKGHHRYLSSHK